MLTSRQQIIQLRLENPRIRAIKLAELVGITRERVRQILKKEGLTTKFEEDYPVRPPTFCLTCGNVTPTRGRKYCSKECYVRKRVVISCAECGKRMEFRPSEHRARLRQTTSGKLFCSRSCFYTVLHRGDLTRK